VTEGVHFILLPNSQLTEKYYNINQLWPQSETQHITTQK